eukprot:Lithocolla_globosa_v1_NODE_2409_length_2018_cov_37.605706.p1 type:complete len:361 gc:universal NODE_2409_length_2018_cov_37.605706:1176-94(-)
MYGLLFTCIVGSAAQLRLIKEDSFDEFDLSFWQHEITLGGGGNWEFQYYSNNRSTSFVEDSVLYLKPQMTADVIGEQNVQGGYLMDLWGSSPANLCTGNAFYGCERMSGAGGNILNPVRSGRVRTVNSLSMRYGRVEVRARIPSGDWLWPAIWMMPEHNMYGEWPSSGEIDIMEARGNSPTGNPDYVGRDHVSSALHWGPNYMENGFPTTTNEFTTGSDLSQDFHVYALDWEPTFIRTSCDGNTIMTIDTNTTNFWDRIWGEGSHFHNPWQNRPNNAPFDQKFYLIINNAVGGTGGYFPDGFPGKPWNNESPNAVNEFYAARGAWEPTWDMNNPDHPSALAIDYVRFYCHENIPGSCDSH